MLDTIIVVNNSNGPQVQATIDPADCLASNGSVTMSPELGLYLEQWRHDEHRTGASQWYLLCDGYQFEYELLFGQ